MMVEKTVTYSVYYWVDMWVVSRDATWAADSVESWAYEKAVMMDRKWESRWVAKMALNWDETWVGK